MSLIACCYVSEAAADLDADGLFGLVAAASAYNGNHDITGCLVYDSGHFAQVLEGTPGVLEPLLKKIATDPRHHRFRVVWSGPVARRMFEDWTTRAFNLEAAEEVGGSPPGTLARLRAELADFVTHSSDKLAEFPSFFRFCIACLRENREPEQIILDPPMFMAS